LPPATITAKAAVEVQSVLPDSPKAPAGAGQAAPLGVVKRDEQDFADWIATEVGFLECVARFDEEELKLEPYQIAFLESTAAYRCVEKARQVGYSWVFSCEAVARSHLRDTHNSIFVSYNLADSKEKIAYAAQLHEELPLEYQKKKVIDSKLELGFRSNSSSKRISRIISNPSRAPRGKKGDIYLDELAHYANDREVYKGSTALILRAKGQMTVCSSPLGRRGQFWEVARQEVKPFNRYWRQAVPWWLCSFFCTNVLQASIEAPTMPTKDRVYKFGTKGIIDQYESLSLDDFQQEFEVMYVDESMSFFPYDLILPCTNDELELAEDFTDIKPQGRLRAGYDVGRKKDFSELAVFDELDDGRSVCRMLKRYDKVRFETQENNLRRMMDLLPIASLAIDQNGIGMHLTENLSDDYPQVEPVTFTGTNKETWATDMKILLQHQRLVLPRDRALVSQIHSIRKRITAAGRPVFESNDSEDRGHADRFWAVALACKKERIHQGEEPGVEVTIIG
jgi:phage FluMu gp28-like protein